MRKKIKLHVTEEDCKNAGAYTDHRNCLLCTAVHRQLKTQDVTVCPGTVRIDGVDYAYSTDEETCEAHGVMMAYYGESRIRRGATKPNPEWFKPFTVTLVERE